MGLPRVLWGPILGPNHGMFSKHNGRGPLGSKGYPNTSFNSGKFPDTYTGFHIGVMPISDYNHTWASPKVQGGPFEFFIAMGGFLGGGGSPFWDFSGGGRPPPCAHV